MRGTTSLDTSALTGPLDGDRLAAFRERHLGELPAAPTRGSRVTSVVLAVSVTFLTGFFVWIMLSDGPPRPDDIFASGILILLALTIVVLPVVTAARSAAARSGARQLRLHDFAASNGLDYRIVRHWLPLPGLIFEGQDGSTAYDVVESRDGRGLIVGNQTFTTGTGNKRQTHRWGFATVQLGTMLPHIVLDAKGNNALAASTLPVSLDAEQRLRLEGDFDRHFSLSVPKGYERDALYLFTPDIMARFVDRAAELDVEIVDDRLFLYSRHDLATLDPAVWTWILTTIDALTEKAAQWQRWRDDSLGETRVVNDGDDRRIVRPPRGVATKGRRLEQRLHWIWIVLGVAAVGFWLLSLLSDLLP